MLRYALRRLATAIPLALGVATVVFLLVETAPGDPAERFLGDGPVTEEVRERITRAYGLDRTPAERYVRWITSLVFRGELGWSHSRSQPVARALGDAIPATVLLTGTALLLHVIAGILLGIACAARRGRWQDRALTTLALFLYAMPTFWLGLMAILAVSGLFDGFPISGMRAPGADGWSWSHRVADAAWHLVLPATVLGLTSAAALMRFVRAGLLDTLGQPFIRAARARGVGGRRVVLTHALRGALIPVINLIGLSLPVLLSGSLVTEVVFSWPGMGRLMLDAIRADDLPLVLAATLLVSLMVVAGNLFADLGMAWADPRIRLGATGKR